MGAYTKPASKVTARPIDWTKPKSKSARYKMAEEEFMPLLTAWLGFHGVTVEKQEGLDLGFKRGLLLRLPFTDAKARKPAAESKA